MALDPTPAARRALLLCVALCCLPGVGCHLIKRTHAKPGGPAYFWNFDRKACRLELGPLETTVPANTSQVYIATVLDEEGKPRRGRRVEWLLEGAGNIVEVDESGICASRGYKVDNHYAVTHTDWFERCITRGNDDPSDDFTIRPGQSWCVVTSAVEGDTKLTAYCPDVFNWDKNRVVVTTRWLDAAWRMPVPGTVRSGAQAVITTEVLRHSDRRPLAGYLVRYRVMDGPEAVFLPNRTQEVVVTSDINGQATAGLLQLTPCPGANRISVEILRPPDPRAPSGVSVPIAKGETQVTWQAAQVGLNLAAPQAVTLGQDVSTTLTVNNTGSVESQEVTLRSTIPEGMELVRTDPPAIVQGNQLIWTLPGLAAGGNHSVTVVSRAMRQGTVMQTASFTTRDGLRDERKANLLIGVARLDLQLAAAESALPGQPVEYRITVSNPGTAPIGNVVLTDDFDAGLAHQSGANPIKKSVGTLAPGQTEIVTLMLTPNQAGRLVNRVTASGDGNLTARQEHAVTVKQASLKVDVAGPARRYVNRQATYEITVQNPGDVPLQNVQVRSQLPPELVLVSASGGGMVQPNGGVVWTLPQLPAGGSQVLEVTANAAKLAPKAIQQVTATTSTGLRAVAEAATEINGLPAFRIEMRDSADPAEVGKRFTYDIDVKNQGTLSGSQLEIVCVVPPELKVIRTRGPTQPKIENGRVTFPPMESLPPGQKISFGIEVEAVQPGKVLFQVEVGSATLREKVIEQESTTIIDPHQPSGPTREPPPATAP